MYKRSGLREGGVDAALSVSPPSFSPPLLPSSRSNKARNGLVGGGVERQLNLEQNFFFLRKEKKECYMHLMSN